MGHCRWTTRLAALGSAAVLAVTSAGCDWAQFRAGPAHSGAVAETALGVGNVATLVPRWSVTLGDGPGPAVDAVGPPVTTAGNVVVVSGSLLLAFAERDGAARWQHALTGGGGPFGGPLHTSPSGAGGVVYVGEKDGFTPQGSHGLIEKVDGATGAGLGFVPTSFLAGAVTPPTLAGGDVWFAFDVTVGGGLRAFGLQGVLADGRTVVNPSAVSPSFASPAVAGGVVYTGDQSGNLAAYDAAGVTGCSDGGGVLTCTPLWSAGVGGVARTPAVDDPTVFAVSGAGALSAVPVAGAPGPGRPVAWTGLGVTTEVAAERPWVIGPDWFGGAGAAATTAPVIANGVVYVGTADGRIQAFARDGCGTLPGLTCLPLWSAPVAGAPSSVIVANSRVVVGTDTGSLVSFGLPA